MGKFRKVLKILKWVAIGSAGFILVAAVFVFFYINGIEEWKTFEPEQVAYMERSLVIFDKDGSEYAILKNKQMRRFIGIEKLPKHVIDAFIAIEDARFWEHPGIDYIRIGGALIEDIRQGSIVQGASTISQQLVKNYSLTYSQNITRKLAEIMMAFSLEQHYTKSQILEMYLNYVYFGNNAYGIETAAKTYFNKSAEKLTLSEAALLAAILKAPSTYAPTASEDKAKDRRNLVLSEMCRFGFITETQKEEAQGQPISLNLNKPKDYPYGYFTDMVLLETARRLKISQTELLSDGYRVYTTLDKKLIGEIESLLSDPENFPENAADGLMVNGSMVVLDAKTGAIRALSGGREHPARLGFNRAVDMRRQPGSALKPIMVFAPAIEYCGYTPTTFILDEPENFAGYQPRNAANKYRGWVSFRDVVAYSINVPSVRILNEITVARGKQFASSVGIQFGEKDKNLSLALGGFTTGITPLELAGAYLCLAGEGMYEKPYCITEISQNGSTLYQAQSEKYNVLSPQTTYLLSSLLGSAISYGTAQELKIKEIPLAAKTGTSSNEDAVNNKDAWVVAYNPEYVVSCWIGFDKTDSLHSLPKGVTGGTFPARLTGKLFGYIYSDTTAPAFTRPDGIVECVIDKNALENYFEARLATEQSEKKVTEIYSANAPTKSAYYPEVRPAEDFSVAPENGIPVIRFTARPGMRYVVARYDVLDDEQKLLVTLFGDGELTWVDTTAQPTKSYVYRLIPSALSDSIITGDYSGPKSAAVFFSNE